MQDEPRDMPHLIIKKVHRESQSKMEEFVKRLGNVDNIYYSKMGGDYPNMFVVFTKESTLNKAYVLIREQYNLFDVTLKKAAPKEPKYCLECMKDSYYFCESCSSPYCSETCQRKNWPEHAVKCLKMPRLVQVQWHETDQSRQTVINLADKVCIVGYERASNSVTLRLVGGENDQEYLNFLDDCTKEAERSPVPASILKEAKVWALHSGQWFRGKVETVTHQQTTVYLIDLSMTVEVSTGDLRLLQSKLLFFRPVQTKVYRLKGMHQKEVLSATNVRYVLDQAIAKCEIFAVIDNANNYVELQIDGQPQSLNRKLFTLYERQTGIAEPLLPVVVRKSEVSQISPPVTIFTVSNIKYPEYEGVMDKPKLYVFSCVFDGLNWNINAINMKSIGDLKCLTEQIASAGTAAFKAPGGVLKDFSSLELDQLCLVNLGKLYDRCKFCGESSFESIDTGEHHREVAVDKVRLLPRELLVKSYFMQLVLEGGTVEDMAAMTKSLETLKNTAVNSIDQLIHTGQNYFKCVWKKA